MTIHKLEKIKQRGTGKVFETHLCGTGEKHGVSGSHDKRKVTCKKCLKRLG